MNPLVSIIVPIYNADKYLTRCLSSIVNQTYTNLEIILINDGSTDTSLTICNEYAKKDKRIVLVNKTNEGASAARNTGIRKSSGEYVAFMDADDWIVSNYIEQLMEPFKNENIDISICNYQICNDYISTPSESNHIFFFFFAREYLLENQKKSNLTTIVPWGKIFKKKIISGIFFPEGLHFEDEATIYKFFYASKQIAKCNYKAYFYFQSKNGLTKSVCPNYPEDAVLVFEEKYRFFKERNDEGFFQYTLATLLWECLILYSVKKDKREYANNKITQYLKIFNQYNINYEHSISLNFFCRFPFIYLLYKKLF